jgi:glycosyltransferase involved in cell wall biosynthesis
MFSPRINTAPRRLVFDLTTSAAWIGPPVGIVRAERELARFALEAVNVPVEYSVFDLTQRAFFRLRPGIAADILDGRVTIDFPKDGQVRLRQTAPSLAARAARAARDPRGFAARRLSRMRQTAPSLTARAARAARDPRGFAARRLSRFRGTTGEQADESLEAKHPVKLGFEAAVDSRFLFNSEDVLVSCGLDWAHKDYGAISDEKDRSRLSYVGVCYDTIPWKFPQFWPDGLVPAVVSALAEMAWTADVVMCISRSTADDFTSFCSELQIPCPDLHVFRLGDTGDPHHSCGSLPPSLEGKRFVLCVSSIEPRKNHRLLYHVWEELVQDPTFPPDVVLAVVGAVQWMTADLVREIQLNPAVSDRIVLINDADDSVLHALYSACLFTVFPSLYEGWGLPVAESLNHGKICVASDRGSIPEVSHLTVMLHPYDHAAWCDAVRFYVKHDRERSELERRIRTDFDATTWRDSAHSFFHNALTCLAG